VCRPWPRRRTALAGHNRRDGVAPLSGARLAADSHPPQRRVTGVNSNVHRRGRQSGDGAGAESGRRARLVTLQRSAPLTLKRTDASYSPLASALLAERPERGWPVSPACRDARASTALGGRH